ncbi:hypothetical protein J6590_051639 [Homalodisca vitripennis]|nr:hypothetical protein J6590_051639 [Homalodisca vitripennis]
MVRVKGGCVTKRKVISEPPGNYTVTAAQLNDKKGSLRGAMLTGKQTIFFKYRQDKRPVSAEFSHTTSGEIPQFNSVTPVTTITQFRVAGETCKRRHDLLVSQHINDANWTGWTRTGGTVECGDRDMRVRGDSATSVTRSIEAKQH